MNAQVAAVGRRPVDRIVCSSDVASFAAAHTEPVQGARPVTTAIVRAEVHAAPMGHIARRGGCDKELPRQVSTLCATHCAGHRPICAV